MKNKIFKLEIIPQKKLKKFAELARSLFGGCLMGGEGEHFGSILTEHLNWNLEFKYFVSEQHSENWTISVLKNLISFQTFSSNFSKVSSPRRKERTADCHKIASSILNSTEKHSKIVSVGGVVSEGLALHVIPAWRRPSPHKKQIKKLCKIKRRK